MANKRVLSMVLMLALLVPAPLEMAGTWGRAAAVGEDTNLTIATPAFLFLEFYWQDDAARFTYLNPEELLVDIFDTVSGLDHFTSADKTIPVPPSTLIQVAIFPKSFAAAPLYITQYTTGVAGSYRVLTIHFTTEELQNGTFIPVHVQFRPYDSTTGAGLAVEQFNITVQFPNQSIGRCQFQDGGPGGNCYANSTEFPVGQGYVDTYYGLNVTVRVRDYFGNLLYNTTKRLTFNSTNGCVPISVPSYSGQCGMLTSNYMTWDLPLQVYSFKVYNQKPDQFIKVKLYWNGTGAGEEVYAPNSGLFPDWWNAQWTYRQRVKLTANESIAVGKHINMTIDLGAFVSAGKLQADYRDLRVVYWSGSAWVDLDHYVDATHVVWKAQATIASGATVRDYFLYYGNSLAGAPAQMDTYDDLVQAIPGLVSYFRLEETGGTSAADSKGSNTGTYTGGVTLAQSGKFGLAPRFDGTNDYVSLPLILSGNTNVGILAWFKTENPANNGQMAVYDGTDAGSTGFGIEVNTESTTDGIVRILYGGIAHKGTGFTAVANQWHMTVLNVKPTTGRAQVYIDNVVRLDEGAGGAPNMPTTRSDIGRDDYPAERHFQGNIDEVAFYTGNLDATQINNLWLAAPANATTVLDSSQGFEWFESPGETVERFLNPGYYQVQLVTDNRTGSISKANLGVNITEANYIMVSGLNITRFTGDFTEIHSWQQIISNGFRPDVIHIGQVLPWAPTALRPMSVDAGVDQEFERIHPFSVLEGTTAYTGAAGTAVELFKPNMSSESDDGSLLTAMTVKTDQFVFQGTEPALTHVWINYTNGTPIWENSTLPPSVTFSGLQGDVIVTTNRTVTTTRISDFRAIWEFSFRYYPTTRMYEASLSLNNSMNRTVLNPYWFVGFPENRSVNASTASMMDLDNNVWLTKGQHFEVAPSGYYMTFDQLNASNTRHFFFRFWDQNSTDGQSTPILQVTEIQRETYQGSNAWWRGDASFVNGFTASYSGDIVIKFTCPECSKIRMETLEIYDDTAGRKLEPTEFFAGAGSVTISRSAVGEVPVGGAKNFRVYFKLQLDPTTSDFTPYTPFLVIAGVGISVFLIVMGATIVSGVMFYVTDGKRKEGLRRKQFWFAGFALGALFTILLYVGRPGGLGFV